MFYYLYQITNLVNNKIYVGVHKTHDMNDGYMGSGKVIKRAIEKYGTDNFRKDILETFQDAKSMYAREKELVTEEFLSREDVYNLRRGGLGGFDYINQKGLGVLLDEQRKRNPSLIQKAAKLGNEAKRNRAKLDPKYAEYLKSILLNANRISQKNNPKGTFFGKKHSDEFKKKMSSIMSEKQQGQLNSQFNTLWITNGNINKKISKQCAIPEGWSKGRIIVK